MKLVHLSHFQIAIHNETGTLNSWRCVRMQKKTQGRRCKRRGTLFCFRLAIE